MKETKNQIVIKNRSDTLQRAGFPFPLIQRVTPLYVWYFSLLKKSFSGHYRSIVNLLCLANLEKISGFMAQRCLVCGWFNLFKIICVLRLYGNKKWGYFCLQGKCKKKSALLGWITILFFRNDMKMNASLEEFLAMEFIYCDINYKQLGCSHQNSYVLYILFQNRNR